jgi:hypothetical protein
MPWTIISRFVISAGLAVLVYFVFVIPTYVYTGGIYHD